MSLTPRKLEAAPDAILIHSVSVEHPTFGTILVTLYGHDANTPAQDRCQLGVAELVKGAVIRDRRKRVRHHFAR